MSMREGSEYPFREPLKEEPRDLDYLAELDEEARHIKEERLPIITREARTRGTHRKRSPENITDERERNLIVRFERAEILRTYQLLRRTAAESDGNDKENVKELLGRFRERAQELERNLDLLSEQLYNRVHSVTVESPTIGHHVVPVAELSLPERAEDEDVPYVVLAGIGTNQHQQAAMAMAFALQGKRVFAITHAGAKIAETPKDWASRVRKNGTYGLHAELLREVVKGLGLKKFHMVGYSMGAGVALEAAKDNEFSEAAEKIDVIEPLGFEKLGVTGLGKQFVLKESFAVFGDPEAKLKAYQAGSTTTGAPQGPFFMDTLIMSREQFSAEDLTALRPEGGLRVWAMNESPLVNTEAIQSKLDVVNQERATQEHPPIELEVVQGKGHALPLVHANGFAAAIDHGPGEEPITEASLDNSAARALFREMLEENVD